MALHPGLQSELGISVDRITHILAIQPAFHADQALSFQPGQPYPDLQRELQ